jgi:hypothetical protein
MVAGRISISGSLLNVLGRSACHDLQTSTLSRRECWKIA